MTLLPRRPRADELRPMAELFAQLMNQAVEEDELAEWVGELRSERCWVVADDGRLVASSTAMPFSIIVPVGSALPIAGVTDVGVAPTHRRRGILTQVMRHLLSDAVDRGDPMAALFASDGQIYGRFGYGVATHFSTQTLEAREAGALPAGTVRWGLLADLADDVRLLFEQSLSHRPGDLVRTDAMWQRQVKAVIKAHKPKPVWAAIGGDGYVVYRTQSHWVDHTARNEVEVLELVGSNATRVELWSFLASLDLVTKVTDGNARLDEPFRHALPDARRLRITAIHDGLWTRVLDVPRVLAARRYAGDGKVTLTVHDAFLDQRTTVSLEVQDGTPVVEEITGPVDLELSVAGLSNVYFGGTSLMHLAGTRQLQLNDSRAAWVLDGLLRTPASPQCLSSF